MKRVRRLLLTDFSSHHDIVQTLHLFIVIDSYSRKMIQARNEERENSTRDRGDQLQESAETVFDRDAAVQLFRDNISLEPLTSSPLRRGTFDLTLLLSMQESIHTVLRKYQAMGESKEVSFEFLRDFYFSKLHTHFDGSVSYGRADDFFAQLLITPPMLKQCTDGKTGLIDPLSIAEEIIKTRSSVLRDWIDISENIPREHIAIRKVLLSNQLSNQMGQVGSSSDTNIYQTESFE
jgi:hypothetical protein